MLNQKVNSSSSGFVAASGGAPRQFRGTLDGSTLAGSIFNDAAAKDKDAVGRFSLRYVE